ncbi:hypothetical protein BDA99DRAFT_525258 [Phascolomyces articulosus]|uniref:Uncharacterized protein n=1 Tax=Phascolomyces articulosus TaxID=60185 RepID=A0AAD5JP79_9FUNG|nr:hypothetical protein BDA99DRAFT_525258 [Phascolomyces articulosus]
MLFIIISDCHLLLLPTTLTISEVSGGKTTDECVAMQVIASNYCGSRDSSDCLMIFLYFIKLVIILFFYFSRRREWNYHVTKMV